MKKNGIFRWMATGSGFLERARVSLRAFDEQGDVQQLFVAALMLRFGIEARLFEYIYAELPTDTRDDDIKKISDFAATRLLARLVELNPRTTKQTTHVFRRADGGQAFGFRYTPVTKSLAAIHGRLGGLLHFNYFRKNSEWYVDQRPAAASGNTILTSRDLIAQGIEELAQATSGTLLNNPTFAREVAALREDLQELSTQNGEV
ncbi:MAG TPA: hypothetical protein VGJ96_11505 [Gemmatimonadaceae bacterium]|jgi:hypothetical protein